MVSHVTILAIIVQLAILVLLVELLLGNVDEKAVERAYTRVSLFFTRRTRRVLLILTLLESFLTWTSTVTLLAWKTRAKAELAPTHCLWGGLRWKFRRFVLRRFRLGGHNDHFCWNCLIDNILLDRYENRVAWFAHLFPDFIGIAVICRILDGCAQNPLVPLPALREPFLSQVLSRVNEFLSLSWVVVRVILTLATAWCLGHQDWRDRNEIILNDELLGVDEVESAFVVGSGFTGLQQWLLVVIVLK